MTTVSVEGPAVVRWAMDLKAMGARLQDARRAAGLTQQVAATKASIDASSLSRYERGVVEDVSARTISELARIYGVRLGWLVDGEGTMGGESSVERDGDWEGFAAAWIDDRASDGHSLTPDEQAWVRGLSFRVLSIPGLEVTSALLDKLLREKRLQDAGRIARGQRVDIEPPENTVDLPMSTRRRR